MSGLSLGNPVTGLPRIRGRQQGQVPRCYSVADWSISKLSPVSTIVVASDERVSSSRAQLVACSDAIPHTNAIIMRFHCLLIGVLRGLGVQYSVNAPDFTLHQASRIRQLCKQLQGSCVTTFPSQCQRYFGLRQENPAQCGLPYRQFSVFVLTQKSLV